MSEHPTTDPVSLPMDVKRKLLAARDALTVGDIQEAYHQIYSIASPYYNKLEHEVWTALETVTPDSPAGAPAKAMPYTSHREALQDIVDAYVARSDLFTNDADCAANLADRARAGLRLSGEPSEMQWRCFHCDEVFTDKTAAAEHFGENMFRLPACKVDIAEYRRMERDYMRSIDNDTDKDRAYYRLQTEMQTAVRRAEEEGYAKGLKDAGLSGEPGGKPPVCYRLQSKTDKFHWFDYDPRAWDLIVIPPSETKVDKP